MLLFDRRHAAVLLSCQDILLLAIVQHRGHDIQNKKSCAAMGPCDSSPCKNGARCTNVGSAFYCSCPENFTGIRCDQERHCALYPCRNGGTCIPTSFSYDCLCPNGYAGRNCQYYDPLKFTTTTSALGRSDRITTAAWGYGIGFAFLGTLIVIICWWTAKKRYNRQSDNVGARNLNRTRPNNVHIFRLSSSVTEQVYEHHHFHQELHLPGDADVEITIDGRADNNECDPTRDLPPSYASVVDESKYVSEDYKQEEQPPTYYETVDSTSLPVETTTADTVSE